MSSRSLTAKKIYIWKQNIFEKPNNSTNYIKEDGSDYVHWKMKVKCWEDKIPAEKKKASAFKTKLVHQD